MILRPLTGAMDLLAGESGSNMENTMRMTVLDDYDSQKTWVSREINHGDFPFRFMIRLQYSEHYSEDMAREIGKYIVGLHVVSPQAARETDSYQSAMNSNGWTAEQIAEWGWRAEYSMLLDYGTSANLWESGGNNLKSLLRQCREQLKQSDFMFGFAMDRTNNAIGTTGWDAIKGDTLAPLRRHSDQSNVQLMQRLQGDV